MLHGEVAVSLPPLPIKTAGNQAASEGGMQGAICCREFERQAKALADASKDSGQVCVPSIPVRPPFSPLAAWQPSSVIACPGAIIFLTGTMARPAGVDMDIKACAWMLVSRMAGPPPVAGSETAGGEGGQGHGRR